MLKTVARHRILLSRPRCCSGEMDCPSHPLGGNIPAVGWEVIPFRVLTLWFFGSPYMLCDNCHQRESSIHVTQVVEGTARELHLCEECAEASGLNVKNVMSIPDMLFGTGGGEEGAAFLRKVCPHCHLRGSDFRKAGRLGCPRCYEAFVDDLNPMLSAMHKGAQHKGKIPRQNRKTLAAKSRLQGLRRELEAAVKREDYEKAACLRDLLREAANEAG